MASRRRSLPAGPSSARPTGSPAASPRRQADARNAGIAAGIGVADEGQEGGLLAAVELDRLVLADAGGRARRGGEDQRLDPVLREGVAVERLQPLPVHHGLGVDRLRDSTAGQQAVDDTRHVGAADTGDQGFQRDAAPAAGQVVPHVAHELEQRDRKADCRCHLHHAGQVHLHQIGTGLAQRGQRRLGHGLHAAVEIGPERLARHADADALQAGDGQRRGVARQHAVEQRTVAHAAGHRAAGVTGGRDRHDAHARHPPHGRAQADHATQGRRHAHRPACVGADRRGHEARRHHGA